MVPGTAVADAEIEDVELRIVGHRIPHGAAAAVLPPLAGPRLRGALHQRVLEAVLRIAGHCVETPEHLAGDRVIRGYVTAHAHLAAAVADDDLALDDARCAGDRVTLLRVGRLHRPQRLAAPHVESDQPAVERADEDAATPGRDAAIHDVATGIDRLVAGDLRIEAPLLFAGARIEREHFAPCRSDIHRAVDDQRCSFLAALGVEIEIPRELQVLHVALVDRRQRAEALLVVSAAVREPVGAIVRGCADALRIHGRGDARRAGEQRPAGERTPEREHVHAAQRAE